MQTIAAESVNTNTLSAIKFEDKMLTSDDKELLKRPSLKYQDKTEMDVNTFVHVSGIQVLYYTRRRDSDAL